MFIASPVRLLQAHGRRSSRLRWAVMLAAAVALTTAMQVAAPSKAAAAIEGRERRISASGFDKEPFKSAEASCSSGKRVVGGGAAIYDGDRKQVRLVALLPRTYNGQFPDGFGATAEAPDLYSPYDWSITAYAICVNADAVSKYQMIAAYVEVPSTGGPFQHAEARCPDGTIAYSAGGQVIAYGHLTHSVAAGQIGLQMNRTSGSQDISRISARERAAGSSLSWRLFSYAVCAEPPKAMNIRGTTASGDEAKAYCDSGWDVIGPGGGGGLTDGGPVWLQDIVPQASTQSVIVRMTGPLYSSIGGMAVHMSCAR